MDTQFFKHAIIEKIQSEPFYKKYMNYATHHPFNTLKLYDKIHHFSWGILYLHMINLSEEKPLLSIDNAAKVECLGLAVELLDDFLDGDNELMNQHDPKEVLFLYTDLLITAIYPLATSDTLSEGLKHLQSSLDGEWDDTHISLSQTIDESIYFEKIIKKSTGFFLFLTHIAFAKCKEKEPYEVLMGGLAEMTQIVNDLNGLKDLSKQDLAKKVPTLPLIKFIESNPIENLGLIEDYNAGLQTHHTLIGAIEASGAIQYCHYLLEEYKTFLVNHIETHFKWATVKPLLNYFHLETWYESIENTG